MFTGIIQDIGEIHYLKEGLYEIHTKLDLVQCKEGSSICCNGVCLTAKNIKKNLDGTFVFNVNIGEETILRSNLGQNISNKKKINIEKSLSIGDEIGGHFVYGHVDNTTLIKEIKILKNSWQFDFEKNFDNNNKFIVEKASISINGISLTISNVNDKIFSISVIDHTYKNTNLQFLNPDDLVNIEFDYLARFVIKNEK